MQNGNGIGRRHWDGGSWIYCLEGIQGFRQKRVQGVRRETAPDVVDAAVEQIHLLPGNNFLQTIGAQSC